MVLYLTDGCNSKCVTCDIWRNPRRNMPMPLIDHLVSQAQALQTRWVLLSGGEAMQHPHWSEIARRFRETGVKVLLLTNGLLLRKQAQQVIDTVDELIVSLDGGNAATYAAIRGVDGFDLILDGIRAVRAGGIPVTTRTTVQRANYQEIPQIIEVGLATDVTTISFLAVDIANPFAFGQRFEHDPLPMINDSALLPKDIDILAHLITTLETHYTPLFAEGRLAESPQKLRRILVDYFWALHGKPGFIAPRCNAPHFSTVIDVDGTLRPCYFLPSYGRLKPDGDPLTTAINTAAATHLRRAYRKGQRAECQHCVCPLHKGARQLLGM
jgi:MoaA/NifB/PqqE/SkfB family radical SAM enzyme